MPAPMDARLIVVLNDNDMSIAPPVGAMSAYLARLISSGPIAACAKSASRSPNSCRIRSKWRRGAPRNMRAASPWAARCSRSWASTMSGPIDGHNLDHLIPVLENVRDSQERPDPRPRRDAEGQRLCARRSVGRQISRRRQIQRAHRRAEEDGGESARNIRRSSAKR